MSNEYPEALGFIGLGNMGSGMAKNLLAAGFSLIGFDVDSEKLSELESTGFQKAASTSEIAMRCKTVILCLPNPETSRKTIFEDLLAEESNVSTIIETSTLTPEIVREFTDKLINEGKQFLSAPMIGGKNHASKGTIEFLVEGQVQVFKENQGIFNGMGARARFMGDVPSATLAKLTFNLCRYANLAVGVKSYSLLKAYGANIEAIYEFIGEQSLDNFGQVWREDLKDTMAKDIHYKPSGVPKKDLALLSEMAEHHKVNAELINAIRDIYLSMEGQL